MTEPSVSLHSSGSEQPSSAAKPSGQRPASEPVSIVDLRATASWGGRNSGPQSGSEEKVTETSSAADTLSAKLFGNDPRASSKSDFVQPATLPSIPRYLLIREIARGGMGVVYQARDLDLNRIVAIKVLHDRYPSDSPVASRFLEEAQITSQLQHPGIPPIYQVGRLADGRPYLAMKLIKGETLDTQIKRGEKLNYLALIEAIARAVGYAHAHGVIHRDLKPQNIMVGPFGEVQVMDWGLAKVLTGSPSAVRGESEKPAPEATTVYTLRSRGSGSETQAGSVVGTLAYMAPEQAAGEIDKLSPRADVFGLGAVLCSLLTGRPPYLGGTHATLLLQAVRGHTADAFARLDACGAEPEVINLCKRCLAFAPEDRPADGNAVAQEVAALRWEAEERGKQAEIERIKAEVMASAQRKWRRILRWSALAVAAVLLIGLGLSVRMMSRAISAERLAAANEAKAIAEQDETEKQRQRAEVALKALTKARLAERQVRDQMVAALWAITDEINKHQWSRSGGMLTEQNKEFLGKIIKHFDGFTAITAGDAETQANRAEEYFRVGLIRHLLGELKEAEKAYRAALDLFRQLAAEDPDNLDQRNYISGICVYLANLCNQRREFAAAKQYLAEAEPHHQAALKFNPRHTEYRHFYRIHLLALVRAHAGMGEQAEAVGTAAKLRDLGWDPPENAFEAAWILAQCIVIAEEHEKLNTGQRREAMQFYGDEAMKMLRAAVEKGFKDLARMKQELTPLREREDFHRLLAEMEEKGKQ